jgi:hypothetical protein
MKGLEKGLRVDDIATYGFLSCKVDDDAAEVMRRVELLPYDCIPVRADDQIVGVLEREGNEPAGTARSQMRPLNERLIVAAEEPLKDFIPLFVETPHRLVVRGSRIDGIVTSSDIHKLPVRLLTFALVTHLEMTMAMTIVRDSVDDDWIELLPVGRRALVRAKFDDLHAKNFDPPLIEVTDFCDKRYVLAKKGMLATPSKTKAIKEFERIEELRNKVAHAATYARSEGQLREFVDLIAVTETWIERLSEHTQPPAAR